jgi:hypothetical protein
MGSDQPRIERTLAAARALVALMEDPHPGLITWQLQVERRMREIAVIYDGIPEKEEVTHGESPR